MPTKIQYSKDALKYLSKLDKKTVNRIREAINGLVGVPPIGDIKPMQGYPVGVMRLRVGKWRVIYRKSSDGVYEIILVMNIGARGDIYK